MCYKLLRATKELSIQILLKTKPLNVKAMKKINLIAIATLALFAEANLMFAQNTIPLDTAKVVVPNQEALNTELNKFGMKMLEFPAGQTCPSFGPAKIHDYPLEGVNPPMDNPIIKRGDFTKVYNKEGEINVIWLHGLNGTTDSWKIPAYVSEFGHPSFPARKLKSIRGTASSASHPVQFYSESAGITGAAADLEREVETYLPATLRTNFDYIISHSQGGIVGREWLRKMDQSPSTFQRFAHGLVTFGTPHAGAEILNNARPDLRNKVPAFMDEACKALSGTLVKGIVNSSFVTRLLISNNMQTTLNNKVCGIASNLIIPYALDNYFKATTNDYYVGAPFLTGTATTQGLNQYTLDVPVVQFYGVEEQPVLWRFMSSSMNMGHDYLDNNQMVFGYNQDDYLQNKVQDMINMFNARADFQDREAERFRIMELVAYRLNQTTSGLALAALKNEALNNKYAYLKAKNWLSDANEMYQVELLGEKSVETVLECKLIEELECRDPNNNPASSLRPAVKVRLESTFYGSGTICSTPSIATKYSNYMFPGLDGTTWTGSCTGTQELNGVFKVIYKIPSNDGVVLSSSAGNMINVNVSNGKMNTHVIKGMPRTNHEQMKNSDETKKALTALYNGIHGGLFQVDFR